MPEQKTHKKPAKKLVVVDFDMRKLWHLAAWGGVATVTLFVAVIAGQSDMATRRVAAQRPAEPPARIAAVTVAPKPVSPQAATAPAATVSQEHRDTEMLLEARRLNEAVRSLAADRDRLAARVATLERSLEDVTGSISRERAARKAEIAATATPQATTNTPPAKPIAPAATPISPPETTDPAPVKTAVPLPRPAPGPPAEATPVELVPLGTATPPVEPAPPTQMASTTPVISPDAPFTGAVPPPDSPAPTADSPPPAAEPPAPAADEPPLATLVRTEYGVDLGGAPSLETLRVQWQALRKAHGAQLGHLRPIVSVRDIAKKRSVELRLVAGPFKNATVAANVCAALVSAGVSTCRPALYEGQRLALR